MKIETQTTITIKIGEHEFNLSRSEAESLFHWLRKELQIETKPTDWGENIRKQFDEYDKNRGRDNTPWIYPNYPYPQTFPSYPKPIEIWCGDVTRDTKTYC